MAGNAQPTNLIAQGVASMIDRKPTLYIFSGLPGTGKTTLARLLARRLGAAYLRIDTIEQALRDLCAFQVQGEGYRLAYRVARDNLLNGLDVVADSCNPIALTRAEWTRVAQDAGAACANIETICSDPALHRRRVESRQSDINGLCPPTWEQVVTREYEPWPAGARARLDTAGKTVEESFEELVELLGR